MVKRRNPSSLRRLWLFALGSLLVISAGELGTRLLVAEDEVLRWHDYGTQLKVDQLTSLVDDDRPPTVVIIGNSMAQQALVPDVLARSDTTQPGEADRYYNAALNGGVPVVMEPWVLDEIVPLAKPRRVIWGLSSIDLSATYGDASATAYNTALSTRPGRLASMDRWISRHSRFVSSRAALRNPSAMWGSEGSAARADLTAARAELGRHGERRNFSINVSDERAAELRQRIAPFALDVDDLAAIVRTVDALRRQGIEVSLVELPVPPRFIELYPQGAATHARFETAVARLAEDLDVAYVPLGAKADAYGDGDFVDFTHLTEAAAIRFSHDLMAS